MDAINTNRPIESSTIESRLGASIDRRTFDMTKSLDWRLEAIESVIGTAALDINGEVTSANPNSTAPAALPPSVMPSFFTVNATLDSLSWVDRRGKLVNATDSGSAMITQRANMFPLYSLMFVDSDPPRLDVVVVDSCRYL